MGFLIGLALAAAQATTPVAAPPPAAQAQTAIPAPAPAPAGPPCAAPEFRQLDFWVGEWDAEFTLPDGSIGHAENRITRDEYGDCVIAEHFRQPGGGANGGDYIGASWSIYDRPTRSWRQMWVDNGGAMFDLKGGPVTGQPHVFELATIDPRGPGRRIMRMIWENVTPAAFTWRWQAQQPDGSWKDAWVIRYKKRAAATASGG
jgi:hypothetical protein